MRPWLWLYRPTVPTARAQSIQVVHMAHAMASRGHEVTLCVDAVGDDILDWYGLDPVAGLRIRVLPRSRTAASIVFRGVVAAWLLRNRRNGVVYARSKRYAREALRAGARVVVEAHEVDSVQAAERGDDPEPARRLEREVLAGAVGVVANAPGTLELLRATHPALPPAVALPNGTAGRRVAGQGTGVGYVGSVRPWKDLDTLARAAAIARLPVSIVGAEPGDPRVGDLVREGAGFVVARAAVPYRDVATTLAGFRVLALPLGRGVLPERLTSPLKLADYLATGLPVVAADVSSVRAVAGDAFVPYRSGDPADLARALRLAHDDEGVRQALSVPRVRTWAERAAEVEAFVEGLP